MVAAGAGWFFLAGGTASGDSAGEKNAAVASGVVKSGVEVEEVKGSEAAPAAEPKEDKAAAAAAAKQAALEEQVKRLAAEQAAQSSKPKMAKLVLSSSPNGAMVHRGDSLLCTTPCDMEVPVGDPNETLLLKLAGYKDYPLKVSLVHGATVALALNLSKAPSRSRNKRGSSKASAKPAPAPKSAPAARPAAAPAPVAKPCLLYTSDAADE